MRQPPEVLQYDLGNGYSGAPPVTQVTRDLVPKPTGTLQSADYRVPVDEEVTVFRGDLPATFLLEPATGSKRTHSIVRSGAGALVIDAGDISLIGTARTYAVDQWCSLALLDYQEGLWVGTSSIVLPTVVVTGHTVADADYVITGTGNQCISYSSLSTDRTVTLPAASSAGQSITIEDSSGSCSWTKQVIIAAAGSDKIHGNSATSIRIWVAYGAVTLQSNGSGKWTVLARAPKTWYVRWTASTSYTPDPDAVVHRAIGVGCGGSGSNASAVGGGGGGGGAGNVAEWEDILPVGASVTITIGSPGAARAAGAGLSGATGGDVSFGTYMTAYGGLGGVYNALIPGTGGFTGASQGVTNIGLLRSRFVSVAAAGEAYHGLTGNFGIMGAGGTGSDGGATPATAGESFLFPAQYPGGAPGSDANSCAGGGGGAASLFGTGGKGGERPVPSPASCVAGQGGQGFGSGGGGAAVTSLGVDAASGAGAPGMIDFWVFF